MELSWWDLTLTCDNELDLISLKMDEPKIDVADS